MSVSTISNLFGNNAIIEGSNLENYTNQYIILAPKSLSKDYRNAKFQLFYAKSGFGTDPSKLGSAIFGRYCADGEPARVERHWVLGIASPEAVEEWKALYGEPIVSDEPKESNV